MTKIYLAKNKFKKEDKHPDLRLFRIHDDKEGAEKFQDIGALWKSKDGKGYSGNLESEKLIEAAFEAPADPVDDGTGIPF